MTADLLRPQNGDLPSAPPNPISAPYWEGLAEQRLLYQLCTFCEFVNSPSTELCRECAMAGLRWVSSVGRGSIYSWTIVHRPVTPAFTTMPYAPAIVQFDEGFQLVTNVIDIEPGAITAGMRVEVVFHAVTDELTLPYVRPV